MRSELETALALDRLVARAATLARPVASLTPDNAAGERARLVACLERGELPVPAFSVVRQRIDGGVYRQLDEARALAADLSIGGLYIERLAELELDLAILDAWGDPRRVRALSARRYGRASESVEGADGTQVPLSQVANALLASIPPGSPEVSELPPEASGRGEASVGSMIRAAGLGIGLDVEVKVEPRLASLAAAGERTVFLADRRFSLREARRLTAHEVFGHLVVAANARAQSLRLLQIGLAGSFADQEGIALYLEEALGLLCGDRMRTLAARVMATVQLHGGASFGDTARMLLRDHGFSAQAAIAVAERAYRGGGVARDAGYLAGFLRVRRAIRRGDASLDELRRGRVSLTQVESLRALERVGLVQPPVYRPSLSLSRRLTFGGTKADTSPPSEAASFTMLELT